MKSFINSLINAYSTSQISKIYIDFLYGDEQYLEVTCIYEIFQDCLYYTSKLFNSNLNFSVYAKQTLNSIINSIVKENQNNEEKSKISKDNLQMWVLTEFPELFYGYHNWIVNRIKESKFNKQVRSLPSKITYFCSKSLK